uniref:NADH-ubiquinone oxidoreductase chain 3 n=1 Tax=Tetraphleps aterrimus TaxID=452413 RepID=A0A4D6P0N7_9HEMI|nr:NADH dehydrogenase subunit 3 [Tetraphleps aterrimus]QCE31841.1 NADH dehydrogenase subunit 3 [Tetraphleps aterrimus]
MMKIMMMTTTVTSISMILMMTCSIIFKKSTLDREKMSPFECGFDPKSSSRLPFSIQFFLIAVLFLVFDIEIVIILPMIITLKMTNMMYWIATSMGFMLILMAGLYHEWNNGVLEWAK